MFKTLSKNFVSTPVKLATGVDVEMPYENKVYNFTLSGLYEGHSVAADVFADLANNRYVLDINFAGQTVGVILQDDVYYISYRQFKFFGDAESAFTMLAGAVALGAGDVNFANQIESLSKEMISVALDL